MKRIFIPLESVTIAHVVRPLRVAQKLREKGIDVVFGVQERFRNIVEAEGFETRLIYCENSDILLEAVRTLNFKKQIDSLPRYMESDLNAIESLGSVDLILGDFRFTIRLAAEKLSVPHAALVNGYYSPFYNIVPEIPGVLARRLHPMLKHNLMLRKMLQKTVLKVQAAPYRKLSKRFGSPTKIKNGFDIAVSDSLTLLCDLSEFTPQKELPEHYHFVGPILWEPKQSTSALPNIFNDKKRPLIYLTYGTSGDERSFNELINMLKNLPVDVLFSTGNRQFNYLPDNIYAIPFVKASDILKHADLMICHGGNGSVYQALQHAVPILCLTTFYDQEWNGQRVADLGLGEALYHADLTKNPIMPIIERLISDKTIRGNLNRFKLIMEKQDGAQNAADQIANFLEV